MRAYVEGGLRPCLGRGVLVLVLAVFVEKKRRAESWVVCHDAPVTVPAYLA
jgi:hypothetical protein